MTQQVATSELPPTMPEAGPLPRGRRPKATVETPEMEMRPTMQDEAKREANQLRRYVEYRKAQLVAERQELLLRSTGGMSAGALVNFDRRAEMVMTSLEELGKMAEWIESGGPEYVPPLGEADKAHWRWARDRGQDVPEHVLAQL